MLYRRFGRTNLQMPVFSCGGMRYQFKWQDVPDGEIPAEAQANLEATIRQAIDSGINHIETARGYGSSERQLGRILPTYPRERLIVQTKVGPHADPAQFTRDFEDSLARLRLDYVDLLGIHGLNNRETLDWSIRPGGCLAAARQLQQRGLVRHVGFSTHGPPDIILDAVRHEADGGFDYVNLHWYYIYQRNFPAIAEAARRDMGVFIISPSDKGGMLYDPPPKLVELCRPLHPLIFNDLFCLSHPQVHTLSIGAARPTDFDRHLEALSFLEHRTVDRSGCHALAASSPREHALGEDAPRHARPCDGPACAAEILPPILQRLRTALEEAVGPALADPFALGLPEWDAAPGQINLPIILWLRNLVRAYDLTAYARMRYNLLGNGGHWFPGQPAANLDGVDLSALAARTGLGPRLRELLAETHDLLSQTSVKRLSQS